MRSQPSSRGPTPTGLKKDVRDLLGQHLALTKGEAVARLEKSWEADVAAFDDIFTEILTMADALSGRASSISSRSDSGMTIPNSPVFEDLVGVDGCRYSLSSFDAAALVVVIFTSNGCPTAKSCEDRFMRFQEEYRAGESNWSRSTPTILSLPAGHLSGDGPAGEG